MSTARRYLQWNHGSETPGRVLAVYAIPERPVDPRPGRVLPIRAAAIGLAGARRYRGAWQPDEPRAAASLADAWDQVQAATAPREPLWLITHGGAQQMDLLGMWEQIETGRIQLGHRLGAGRGRRGPRRRGYICSGPVPFYLRFDLGGASVKLADVCNYAALPLAAFVGQAAAESIDGAHPLPRPALAAAAAPLIAAGLRDWVCSLMDQWRTHDLGTWQATAGRLAMSAYRHFLYREHARAKQRGGRPTGKNPARIVPCRIVLHDDPEIKALERDAFFGGEATAFRVGEIKGPVVKVDVRAFYPWIASAVELPVSAGASFGAVSPQWLAAQHPCYGAIADVELFTHLATYPVRWFPRRPSQYVPDGGKWDDWPSKDGSITLYPTGIYRTVLCGQELLDALRDGLVTHVFGGRLYTMGRPFGVFFLDWYKRRELAEQSGDAAGALLAKMICNSLIGKFGQRGARWRDAPQAVAPIPWGEFSVAGAAGGERAVMRSIGWHVQQQQPPSELAGSAISIPAFVCSAGRSIMRELRRLAPPGTLILQDTDGLMVEECALQHLAAWPHWSAPGMGSVRPVARYESLHVWGPRHYLADGEPVLAGVKRGSTPTGPGTYLELLTIFLGSAFAGLRPGESLARCVEVKIRADLVGRKVLHSGDTAPYWMNRLISVADSRGSSAAASPDQSP